MNALRACARRTCGPTFQRLRAVLALMLVLSLGAVLTGSPPPARAADIDFDNPTRLQIILRSVYIYEDRDLIGGGEFTFSARLYRCPADSGPCIGVAGTKMLTEFVRQIDADTDDTVTIDHVFPTATDASYNGFTLDESTGLTLFPGEYYALRVQMIEHDEGDDDWMGWVEVPLNVGNNWHLGEHWGDALRDGGPERGDFTLKYEIVRTPLADLVPFSAPEYFETGHAAKQVCAWISNIGFDRAGSFNVKFTLPPSSFPQTVAVPVGGLEHRQKVRVCTLAELNTSGPDLTWGVNVDSERDVPEMFENNNKLSVPFTPRAANPAGPLVGPSPAPVPPSATPTAGKADLTVSAIKVNGQAPDGKDDCKDGKNTVAVLVKNVGSANAGDVQLRLVIDGAEAAASEQAVKGLDAGEEREIKFGGVQLKKGPHTLAATVDPDKAVAEADEANNTRTVTASCSDGD